MPGGGAGHAGGYGLKPQNMKRKLRIEPPADPHARAAFDAGGTLIYVPLDRDRLNREMWQELATRATYTPGCGQPTYVAATNGGTMPCGGLLTQFGETRPYFCGACDQKFKQHAKITKSDHPCGSGRRDQV